MPVPPISSDTVTILLALYNGAENLSAQLDSFCAQSHTDWRLIISDDGSTDGSVQMARDFAAAHPEHDIKVVNGPCAGYAQNFLSLLLAAGPDVPYGALSDQDDVWLPQKLARSVAALAALPAEEPALYCSRTEICGEALEPMGLSPLFIRPPSFRNALVQNIAGGNTMVLNRAALTLVQDASRNMPEIISHDWWVYQIITGAGGTVIYDPQPSLKYRQHDNNLIGANNTVLASLTRIRLMFQGRFGAWNRVNMAALSDVSDRFTPQNRICLETFAAGRRKGLVGRIAGVLKSGVYRQTRKGNIALVLAAIMNKI